MINSSFFTSKCLPFWESSLTFLDGGKRCLLGAHGAQAGGYQDHLALCLHLAQSLAQAGMEGVLSKQWA